VDAQQSWFAQLKEDHMSRRFSVFSNSVVSIWARGEKGSAGLGPSAQPCATGCNGMRKLLRHSSAVALCQRATVKRDAEVPAYRNLWRRS
jgi:hypothetical protein